jgi:alkanesulfonate monooxygenase SsuD/methylene tetrahydromethanopterin reductase-like flavin-dependent oxidoreductase (luciferase family)
VPSSAVGSLGSGEAYAEFFRQVETLGLDAVWTEDRIFHGANMLDPLMLLASAAASTRRIELGTAVLVLTLRNAAVLARQVSTLQHLSGGRLALGVSLGGRPEEYAAVGVPMARRVAVFRESVTVLRRLLAGEPVDHHGEFFRLEQATVRPPRRFRSTWVGTPRERCAAPESWPTAGSWGRSVPSGISRPRGASCRMPRAPPAGTRAR